MPISEMTVKLSCKKRFWFIPALTIGVVLCHLLRRETVPEWFVDFILKHGMKVEVTG